MRTVMQWEPGPTAGFSPADPATFAHPLAPRASAGAAGRTSSSSSGTIARCCGGSREMIRTLKECPEVGTGTLTVLDQPLPPAVLAHRFDADEGTLLLLHNLDGEPVTVDIGRSRTSPSRRRGRSSPTTRYPAPTKTLNGLALNGYGYRWIRLRRGWVA